MRCILLSLVCGAARTRTLIQQTVNAGFGTVATAFLAESVCHMIPWLIAMEAAVACDLITAVYRCVLMGEEIRLSRAVRCSMAKMVTYYAIVITVCLVDTAAGGSVWIERSVCLLVVGVELWSAIANALRPQGIHIDSGTLFGRLFGKAVGVDMEGVFKKEEDETTKL